jgi:hypothetical protein
VISSDQTPRIVALPPASSIDEPENDQEENCANGGGDDGGHYTRAKMDSESGQEPIADEGADDANAKVRHEPKAGASHDLAGKPARDQSDQQNDQQTLTRHLNTPKHGNRRRLSGTLLASRLVVEIRLAGSAFPFL